MELQSDIDRNSKGFPTKTKWKDQFCVSKESYQKRKFEFLISEVDTEQDIESLLEILLTDKELPDFYEFVSRNLFPKFVNSNNHI